MWKPQPLIISGSEIVGQLSKQPVKICRFPIFKPHICFCEKLLFGWSKRLQACIKSRYQWKKSYFRVWQKSDVVTSWWSFSCIWAIKKALKNDDVSKNLVSFGQILIEQLEDFQVRGQPSLHSFFIRNYLSVEPSMFLKIWPISALKVS